MIAIIDYGMGNLGSIKNMFKKIGAEAIITSDLDVMYKADKLLLPGVGHFKKAMDNLNETGLSSIIQQQAASGKPIMGICLGMQLLASHSQEGDVNGLNLIPGEVQKFSSQHKLKVPHMGWNRLNYNSSCPLFNDFHVFDEARFYFVHSYFYICTEYEHSVGTTEYGITFTSAIQKDNVFGMQFHPEKSHKFGMKLFENFHKL
ncbi:MAG: imidazole glycerol phosphate synthase subunit HisH [Bacteroidetes bacterium]|nr:imidazole glycerol phosphate synthase subunit HisH [Bacteroidota bacterium]